MYARMQTKTALARSLGVSRQSLYYVPRRPFKDEVLRDQILRVLDENPGYGHRRIAIELKANRKRIHRVMAKFHIRPTILRGRRKWPKRTADCEIGTTPNHIKAICPIQPDVIWVGDFTELVFHARRIFLATVLDAFTREVIGWQIALHHTTRLVLDVLEEARRKRGGCPTYFHSDQGSEYAANECVQWLVRHGITPSMSPKGKPWNNGKQESFYLTFKTECGAPQRLPSVEALIEAVGRYISYYNSRRIHSALKMPPHVYYEAKKWKR